MIPMILCFFFGEASDTPDLWVTHRAELSILNRRDVPDRASQAPYTNYIVPHRAARRGMMVSEVRVLRRLLSVEKTTVGAHRARATIHVV